MTASTTIQGFFDPATGTVSYVVWEHAGRHAAVIDPVLDYDFKSGHTGTVSADRLLGYLREHELQLDWILETHAHADHLSGARHVQQQAGGKIAIGENIRVVQSTFGKLFNFERAFLPDGSQFDHLFRDGEVFRIGEVEVTAWLVPGHTPADMAYLVDGAVFVGDTLFMPDLGSARADFPGGDARQLYRSIQKLLSMPPETRLFMCHDYKAPGRDEYRWETTVADQRRNVHLAACVTEDEFVQMREERDSTLSTPKLLLPSIQVNIRAGRLPPAEENGVSYLRIPVRLKGGSTIG